MYFVTVKPMPGRPEARKLGTAPLNKLGLVACIVLLSIAVRQASTGSTVHNSRKNIVRSLGQSQPSLAECCICTTLILRHIETQLKTFTSSQEGIKAAASRVQGSAVFHKVPMFGKEEFSRKNIAKTWFE